MKVNSFCKHCNKKISRLSVKNSKGIYVFSDLLTRDERQSIKMDIPVPYEEELHSQIIHNDKCNGLIPRCHRCGEMIGFVKTKEGRTLPILWYALNDEEKHLFHLGLSIEYSHLEHKFDIHLNKCEVKQRWKAKKPAGKSILR